MIAAVLLSPAEWNALWLSAQVATWCVLATAIPGLALGWLLARREFRGKLLLDAIVHLPLVLPPVVVGFVLLLVLGEQGFVGRWLHQALGWEIAFTWKAAVIASGVMGFPLMVRAIRLSIESVDPRLEGAAATLGAGPWRRFITITVPLSLPGILTGFLLAFARSLGEFGATITFAGNIAGETRTLPLALFTYAQSPGGDVPAVRLVIISVVLAFIAVWLSELMAQRVRRITEATP